MNVIQKTINVLNSIPNQTTDFGTTNETVSEIEAARKSMLEFHSNLDDQLHMHEHMEDDPDTDLNYLYLSVVHHFPEYALLSQALSIKISAEHKELYDRSWHQLINQLGIILPDTEGL